MFTCRFSQSTVCQATCASSRKSIHEHPKRETDHWIRVPRPSVFTRKTTLSINATTYRIFLPPLSTNDHKTFTENSWDTILLNRHDLLYQWTDACPHIVERTEFYISSNKTAHWQFQFDRKELTLPFHTNRRAWRATATNELSWNSNWTEELALSQAKLLYYFIQTKELAPMLDTSLSTILLHGLSCWTEASTYRCISRKILLYDELM